MLPDKRRSASPVLGGTFLEQTPAGMMTSLGSFACPCMCHFTKQKFHFLPFLSFLHLHLRSKVSVTMADARYYHSTLYKLNHEARAQVIARFNTTVNDVAARCWYDEAQDLFELCCPGVIGPDADDALDNAITTYIEQELRASEQENRPSNAARLPESCFDEEVNEYVDFEDLYCESPANGSLADILAHQHSSEKAVRTLHLVNTESSPSMALKLFRLHELPEGVLERTLGSHNDKSTNKAVRVGLTCRAVRSEGRSRDLLFNGRVGQPLPMMSVEDETAFLKIGTFPALLGTSTLPEEAPVERRWKFKESEDASVSQWLAGMGQTEPDEPNQRADVPRDAKKMLVVDQNPALGRVRIPKGTSFLPADCDDGVEERTPRAAISGRGFVQLLQGRVDDSTGSEKSDMESQASSDTDESAVGLKNAFSSLLQKSQARNQVPSRVAQTSRPLVPGSGPAVRSQLQRTQQEENTAPKSMPKAQDTGSVLANSGSSSLRQCRDALKTNDVPHSSSTRSHTEKADQSTASTTNQDDSFPSYGKPFAAVDAVGLTANATSQAQWEIEHHVPITAKSPNGKVQLASRRRQQPLSSLPPISSADMNLSTGSEVQRQQHPPAPVSLTSTSQATIRSYSNFASGSEPWANRVVATRAPTGMLVDDAALSAAPALPRGPPGLCPPPGLSQTASHNYSTASHSTVSAPQTAFGNNLINLVDESIVTQQEPVKPPPGLYRKVPLAREHQSSPQQTSTDDHIVERIQPRPEEADTRRYTMRQKAGPRKSKGNASKQVQKVELPLPDPVPPPRIPKPGVNSAAVKSTASSKAVQGASNTTTKSIVSAASPQLEQERPKLLEALESFVASTSDPIVEIQFGIVLLHTEDKALRKEDIVQYQCQLQQCRCDLEPETDHTDQGCPLPLQSRGRHTPMPDAVRPFCEGCQWRTTASSGGGLCDLDDGPDCFERSGQRDRQMLLASSDEGLGLHGVSFPTIQASARLA